MTNNISGLALQYPRKNWGSFWSKTDKERKIIKAMKKTLINKGKPVLIGKSLQSLLPKEEHKESLIPISKGNL